MNKGDIIIAKDSCKMNTGYNALTIGRGYKVTSVGTIEFSITDDKGDNHWYYLEGEDVYTKWFHAIDSLIDYPIY